MDPEFLKCRICDKHLQPPIRRCGAHSTHMFCQKCITRKNNKCTICQNTVLSTNDIAIEALLKIQNLKCKNENCKVKLLSLTEKLDHERNCKFDGIGGYKCEFNQFCKPTIACTWIGGYDQIEQHFRSHITPLQKNQIKIKLNTTNKYIQLVKSYNLLFWYKHFVSVQTQKVYFITQAVSYDERNKFEFKMKFISLVDLNKTWTLTENCYDAGEDADAYFIAERCIHTGFRNLQPFINDNIVYMNLEIFQKRKWIGKNNNENSARKGPRDQSFFKEQKNIQEMGDNRAFIKGQIDKEVANSKATLQYSESTPSTITIETEPTDYFIGQQSDNVDLLPSDDERIINPPSYEEATNEPQRKVKYVLIAIISMIIITLLMGIGTKDSN